MKKYIVNEKGLDQYNKAKKQILIYILTFPVFIPIITFLFILGTKSKGGLYFTYALSSFFAIYILSIIISMISKTNRMINSIIIERDIIKFETFGWNFVKRKVISVHKREIEIYPYKFRLTEKAEEEGWKIRIDKKEFYLIKNFFNEDVGNLLNKDEV
jgi:hypothetical protein